MSSSLWRVTICFPSTAWLKEETLWFHSLQGFGAHVAIERKSRYVLLSKGLFTDWELKPYIPTHLLTPGRKISLTREHFSFRETFFTEINSLTYKMLFGSHVVRSCQRVRNIPSEDLFCLVSKTSSVWCPKPVNKEFIWYAANHLSNSSFNSSIDANTSCVYSESFTYKKKKNQC